MALLKCLSELFEKMKRIVKSKDLTPGNGAQKRKTGLLPKLILLMLVWLLPGLSFLCQIPEVQATTVDVSIIDDDDDAEELAIGGTPDLSSSDLELINDGSDQEVGVRFRNITIPPGATIINAYIQFQADESQSEATSLTIHGEDIDNAPIFTTASGNITGRTETSASVSWNSIPSWTSGDRTLDQRTPDLSTIVQEIVDIGTWSSGNSMVFLFTGSGHRTAEAGPGADSGALHVEYSTAGNDPPDTPNIDNYNDGSCTNNTTPTLQFDLNDVDDPEEVKYQIQIDDESSFSSPYVVDYTEPSTSTDPRPNETYTPSALSQDEYYWRVKAIDDESAESGWATANSGAVAFIVDTADPITPGNLTYNSKSPFSVTLNFGSQTIEANFDTYKVFYKQGSSGVAETDTEHTDSNLGFIDYNSASTTTINNLAPNTQYVFNIWAYDKCSKSASATEVSVTTDEACFTVRNKSQGSGTTADVIVDKPSGTVEGDLMIATAIHDAVDGDLTASGWTIIEPAVHSGTQMRTRSWYKVAGASEPSTYTFSWDGLTLDRMHVHIISIIPPGGGTWGLEDSSYKYQASSSNTITSDSVTGVTGGLLYGAFGDDDDFTVSTPPSDMGEDYVTVSDGLSLATYYGCTSAESVTKSITWSDSDHTSAMAAVFSYTGGSATTTLGDGTDPGNSTVAPGSADQYLDQFTFQASTGADSVTALTVTTANTAAIASMEIWNDALTTQYFSTVSTPVGDTWSFSGPTAIPVSTSAASFRVRFTAKTHAALAAGTYAVTGTVTSYTCTNAQAGTDTDSATITVDNTPPADATWGTITPGDTQIELNWTNPVADFNKVLILRNTSTITDEPAEGTEYSVPGTIGSSTIVYVGSLETFTDSGLTNGTDYYYKIFAYDDYINYASGAATGPHTPQAATLNQAHVRWRNDDGGETGGSDTTQVSATADTTTASATYVALDSMSITPGAGDYLVWFSGSIESSAIDRDQFVTLALAGTPIGHTERQIHAEDSIPGTPYPVATHAYISGVTAGQAIAVYWKTENGDQSTMYERTLTVTKVDSADVTQATATADTTLATIDTYSSLSGMSITPGPGDYMVWFSGSMENSAAGRQDIAIFVGGSEVPHTERQMYTESSILATSMPVATHAKITGVGSSEAIEVRWRTTAATATMHERTLVVYKITASDYTQVTATSDDTTTSGTYNLVDSMTITPGAGNYNVWFSSSLALNTTNYYQDVSIFVGGTQVTHTERTTFHESSLDNLGQFNVMTHAYVTVAGASDAIEVRWRTTGGTATMFERTLVVQSVSSSGGATWAADEDTKLTGLAKQTTKRLRFLVDNSGGATSGDVSYELQVQETATCGSGSYTAVDSSTHWNIVDSTYVTDGDPSSNVTDGLTDPGSSSWVDGELEDSADSTDTITLDASKFTEIEFAVQATTNATDGGDYCFKLVKAGSGDLDSYSQYAQVSLAVVVTTTLGDGTDPSNSTVAPGSADQYLDQFTLVTNTGTDSVTALTVTTANTAAIASMEIWNDALTTQYFSTVSTPVGDAWNFSGGTAIPVTTSSASFRVLFTAKSHATLAAGTYAVTGTVTSYTCTNAQAGTDTDSATITVDNTPPADATWGTITPGDTQIELNWTNPVADFNKVLILRNTSTITDAPTDGTEYNVNDPIGTSIVRYVGSLETFTDTGLTNGTAYYYKIFAYDDYINYASGAATGPHTPNVYTTLGDGTDPSNSTVAPGSADQYLDQFTFQASTGTDSVTALTVTTANTAAFASMQIWNDALTTQYFSTVSTPVGDTWSFSGGTAIPVTTSSASFRIRFTAKDHGTLAEGTYPVTGTVTSYTCTNSQAGTDTDSATITVDNSPPADATWGTITPGDTQIELNWTNPVADFNKVLILRNTSTITDAPTDGTEYNVNDPIGTSIVRYVGSLETFTDTGLTNGTAYYYKIFAYDDYINYASGAATGPHTPAEASATTNYRSIGTSTDDFKTGTPNITISSGTATLTVDQTGNIGVGDKITYDTSSIAYITAKQSNKVFTVQTEAGGTPTDVSDKTVDSIKRAYNTLQAWEDPVASNGRGGDLMFDNRVEVGVCYKDGAFTSTALQVLYITGNTTDSTHYMELTVAEGNRHDGTAGATGTSNAMIDGENGARKGIRIESGQDVRIKWLELKNFSGANYANAMHIDGSGSNIQLEYSLIHDFINGTLADANKSYGIKISGSGNNTVTVRNCIVYNGDSAGITGDDPTDTVMIENCTVYGVLGHGINAETSNIDVKNTICVNNGVGEALHHDFSNSPTLEYCISEDDTAGCATCMANRTPTANGNPGTGDWVIFNNITAGSEDFHLQYHSTENDALDKAPPLSFTDDIDGETRPTSALSWDIGADEYIGAPVTVNYRSIGTKTPTVYSTGTASICSGDTVVNFSSGASLPESTAVGAVGVGDKLTIGSETFYIVSRDSATQVTVQSAATADHESESYTIQRAYTDIQTWETARGVATLTTVEVGVCYDDGDFTAGAIFAGSTTDSEHYMRLTVAEGQRHGGRAGPGVVVDGGGPTEATAHLFNIQEQYVRIEWIQIKNFRGITNIVQPIIVDDSPSGADFLFANLIIYDYTSAVKGGMNLYDNGTIRNCILYKGDTGVRTYGDELTQEVTIENCTIYNMTGDGVYHHDGTITIKNVISVGNGDDDFDLVTGETVSADSGYNMYNTWEDQQPGSTGNQTPPASLDDLFYSITVGTEDLHIHSSGHLALNNGVSLSFTDDIDGDTRPQGASWDIGADEHSTPGPGIYVDGNLGNDSNAGTWDAPYATVSQAESVASAGDTIYIRGGITYSMTELYVNVSGTSDNPITFQKWPGPESNPLISAVSVGEGGDDAVAIAAYYIIFDSIDATSAADDGYQISGDHVTIRNCSVYGSADEGISIKQPASGSTIDNCKIYNNSGRGIMLEANANALTIKNCEIYGNVNYGGISIVTTTAETILIEYNTIYNHTDAGDGFGIDLECNGAEVRYNKIYNNYKENIFIDGDSNIIHHNLIYNSTQGDGIEINDGTAPASGDNNVIYNNTIDGNGACGINLNQAGSGNVIINNIISNNVDVGINDNYDNNEPDDSYNCLYYNNGTTTPASQVDYVTVGTGTIYSDPLFIDRNGADDTLGTADDDFHLQSTYGYFPFASGCVESASDSPCIDAGAPSGDYSAYSNEPENNGDQVNMGVYGNTTAASLSGAATAIGLLSFTATGDGSSILVAWETAQEINNMGFYLYRSTSRGGPFIRLTAKLIPGLFSSVLGKEYTYEDTDVVRGKLYYYKLEDLDAYGTRTFHGPICVDWDGDGLPDDWEIAHGLNPAVNDAYLDSDFDGLTNLEEYELGTDPLNPDTDGDGILDGEEAWRRDRDTTTRTLTKGVEILASDESGVTLELTTDAFDMEIVEWEGEAYERLRVLDYIHGYIPDVGKPELPLKGILLDIPSGKSATLTVEDVEAETYSGYWIYPVPENVAYDDGAMAHVEEVFAIDEAAYSTDAFYPNLMAELGEIYTFRDQKKLQVLFYPFAFDPVTRELRHYSRIRVRVTFEDAGESALMGNSLLGAMAGPSGPSAAVWGPPSEDPVYKILVSEEGIYRLKKTFFTDNTIDVGGMDLSQVRLYNLDNVTEEVEELAIHVYDQGVAGQFDDNDYIEFYGQPVDEAYAKYTNYNVYWLTISGGTESLKRMAPIDGTPVAGPLATMHTYTVTYEKDERYWIGAPGGDSLDRWFFDTLLLGDQIGGGGDPVDFNFSIPGVVGQGSLTISLSGYYDTDHEVTVWLNGNPTPIATLTWSGITAYEGTISPLTFDEGDNTVTLRCESGLDIIYVDKFMATYARDFAVSNDELIFTHDAGHHYQVTGFTTSDLMAFDITFPGEVKRVENLQISNPPGPYTLDCEPQSETEVPTYYILSTDRVKTPVRVSEDVASTLSDPANSADYILITHRDLGWDGNGHPYPWLDPLGDETSSLVTLRQNQGLRVKVVDVEDIYDEFTGGMVTPQAIKDLMTYAYNKWTQPAPQYVLLVGDSNFDCKDNLGEGNINFVPAYLTFTEYMGEAPTDEWFVRVSGDDAIPDLYIGRLPAASAGEAAFMVNKIITYEGTPNTKTWEKNVLLVADNETEGNDYEADFELMSEDVAALIPAGMNEPFKGYLGDYGATGLLTTDIKEAINQEGTLIVNYSGHGSTQIWADEHIFLTDDVPDLTNEDALVFMVNMTCLTGYFANPELGFLNEPSLMEGLLRPEGKGAVAAFMPTGMTTTTGQRILDSALFEAIFTDDIRALGPAISQAKQTLLANGSHYEEVSETFLLFGDPAMKLKIPVPRRPTGVSLQSTSQGIIVSWNAATDCKGEPVSGYNVYRSTSAGGAYEKINTVLVTETEYTDTTAVSGTRYYYVIRSVDWEDDESAQTLQLSALAGIGTGSGSSGGSSGPCFISTAGGEI